MLYSRVRDQEAAWRRAGRARCFYDRPMEEQREILKPASSYICQSSFEILRKTGLVEELQGTRHQDESPERVANSSSNVMPQRHLFGANLPVKRQDRIVGYAGSPEPIRKQKFHHEDEMRRNNSEQLCRPAVEDYERQSRPTKLHEEKPKRGPGRPRKFPPLPLTFTPPPVQNSSEPTHYESPTNVTTAVNKKRKTATASKEEDNSSKSNPSKGNDNKKAISSTEGGVEKHLSRIADVMERMSTVMIEFYQAQINSMKSGSIPNPSNTKGSVLKVRRGGELLEEEEGPASVESSTQKGIETIMPLVTTTMEPFEQQENSDPSNNAITAEDFNLPNKPFGGHAEEPLSKDNLGAYFRSRAVLTKSRLFK
jgi:hypothetical protein